MTRREPYGMEKDLKVLKGRSNRHFARLEGRFLGIMPDMEIPSGVWKERKSTHGTDTVEIKDPKIYIDLDIGEYEHDNNFINTVLSLFDLDPRDGHFDVISTMEKILRSLAKARFKNLALLTVGEETAYEHPEREWDLRDVLKGIKRITPDCKDVGVATAVVLQSEEGSTEAHVAVRRVHLPLTHDIMIEIHGTMEGEYLNRIINYLEKNLDISRMIER